MSGRRVGSMVLLESGEMYLETIFRLSMKNAFVRSIDVAEAMGYSKPSVSRAMGLLRTGGYLIMEPDGKLILTDKGRAVAENIYERHKILSAALMNLGVSEETAIQDACRVEHYISEETFQAVKKHALPYVSQKS